MSLFDWPFTTKKEEEEKLKNVKTLLHIEVVTGDMEKFTILSSPI
jgi:hypothetical protein